MGVINDINERLLLLLGEGRDEVVKKGALKWE